MNRRTFFRNLAIGAVAAPVIAKALADDPKPRTLIEWLNDVRAEHAKVNVICSSDALEYFRDNSGALSGAGQTGFTTENYPYRWTKNHVLINPYFTDIENMKRVHKLNPAWQHARTEIAFAYGDSTVHYAPFDRETFRLLPA